MSNRDEQDRMKSPRILVVDDTEVNRDIIGAVLSSAGFTVDFASDGESACEAVWGTYYDLVLMDIEMPGMNGFEAAARIRAREGATTGLTIVALTATQDPSAQDFSFWSGIDEFIARPINARTLTSHVSRIIAERRRRASDWRPVWRLKEFSDFTKRLGKDATEAYIARVIGLLSVVASLINAGASGTSEFSRAINELLNVSSMLGLEETTAMCRFYKESGLANADRCRDPNMLGVIDRARYAIASYKAEERSLRALTLRGRSLSNVQDLLKRKAAVRVT